MEYIAYGGQRSDVFFNAQTSSQQTGSRSSVNPSNVFPPIGTFNIESTMTTPAQGVFGGGDGLNVLGSSGSSGSIGIFNANTIMTAVPNNMGGNSSNTYSNQTGSVGADANQGTRETGIIEKLLVRLKSSNENPS